MKAEQTIRAMELLVKNEHGEITSPDIPCYIETDDGTPIDLGSITLTDVQTVAGSKPGLVFKGRR